MVDRVGDVNALALKRGEHRHRSHLAKTFHWTRRQIEASRIRAIHDIEVVIARNRDDESRQTWKCVHRVQKLSPFRRCARVGQITGDDDRVERLTTVYVVESS